MTNMAKHGKQRGSSVSDASKIFRELSGRLDPLTNEPFRHARDKENKKEQHECNG